MLLHFFYATILVFTTVIIHATAHGLVIKWIGSESSQAWSRHGPWFRTTVVAAVVLLMSFAAVIESAAWAGLYVAVGAFSNPSDAIYFSLVTFTTLGYGDITLSEQWRLLGGFQAANGTIIFGWTTALLVFVIQRLLTQHLPDKTQS